MARSMASRARSGSTPASSNRIRPGLDHRHPVLGVALARAHAGLGGLLGHGLVGEHPDPHLAATLDVPGHGDTGGLDLAGGEPGRLEGLDAEVAEVDVAAALGQAVEAGPRCCLRCLTLRGINIQSTSLRKCGVSWCSCGSGARSPRPRPGCARVVGRPGAVGAAMSPARLVDQALGRSRSRRRRRRRRSTTLPGLTLLGPTAAATGGDEAAGTRSWPDVSPTAMAASRVILSSAELVGQDVPLVDPHLHPDTAEGGPGLTKSVVDVGPQGVSGHPALRYDALRDMSEPPRRPAHWTRTP